MAVPTGSRHADASALEALVDAAAGILAADSLSDTLGRIAHHLGELLDYDELTVYEVDRTAGMLVPVFALERVRRGGDGRLVPDGRGRHRLGRHELPHAQRRARRPGPARRRGRGDRDGAGVTRVRAAGGRRPRRGRAQRLPDRDRQAVHRGRGRPGRALRDDGGAGVRVRAPARHAARAGAHRRPHGPAEPPRVPRAAAARRSRAPPRSSGRSASSSSTSTTSRP